MEALGGEDERKHGSVVRGLRADAAEPVVASLYGWTRLEPERVVGECGTMV